MLSTRLFSSLGHFCLAECSRLQIVGHRCSSGLFLLGGELLFLFVSVLLSGYCCCYLVVILLLLWLLLLSLCCFVVVVFLCGCWFAVLLVSFVVLSLLLLWSLLFGFPSSFSAVVW